MKMFSLILLYALILTCKSSTALTASKIQDSTMTNSYKDDNDTSWIVKGQLIYEFAIKYKKIRQLSILWCNHKINLKLWRKHENNEKIKFILNRKHDKQQMVYEHKKQEQEEQKEYQKYENEQDQKFENQQSIHITKQQQQHQQEEEQKQQQEKYKIERKWQKQIRKIQQTRNFQRVNKKNNDNISGIITMLKILYNNNSGKIAVEQNEDNECGSSTSSSSDDTDSRSDSSVSIKPIPIDSLLLSIDDEDGNEKQKRSNRRSSNKRNGPSIKNKCKNKIVNEANEEYMKKKILQILKSEDLHQIIVLDMSCGEDSLQILKMASDMELFNSSYHWLLISDYAVDYRYPPIIVNTTRNDTMNENNFADEIYKDNDVDVDDDVNDECKYEQSQENKISELIEFFDKLNINMNTEMILAKKNNIDQSNQHNYILFDIWNPGWQFGGKLNITKVGIFSQYNGLQMYDWYKRTTTIVRRMNMKNVPIRCMIVVTNKFSGILENYLRDERDYHLDSMHRFNFALLNHVKDLFNFRFQLYRTNSWGYEHNGTYDGMIGALIRREIEIGGSPIFFLIERARLIDYTTHTWTARPCFIFRHPDKIHFIRNIFLEPFSNGVWISLVICGIMVILLLWKTIKFEESIYWMICNGKKQFKSNNKNCSCNDPEILLMRPSSYKKYVGDCNHCGGDGNGNSNYNRYRNRNGKSENYEVESLYSEFSISYVLFFIGTLCQQGVSYRSNLCSGRCLIISTLFLTFCINQFYSASIVGTLLMEKPKTMKTLRDLINSPLNIIIEDILYNHDFFRRTTDPDAIELYRRKINTFSKDNVINIIKIKENDMENFNKTGLNMKVLSSSSSSPALQSGRKGIQRMSLKKSKSAWYNVENGLKLLKKGGYAFHVDVATAYKIIKETFTEREICELTEIQLFPPRKMINIVRKGSPLRKMITYGLRRTRESGLMNRQRKLWHSKKPRCVRKIQPDDLKVDIQTLVSAVFILISGLISSIVILFLEILYDLWQKSKK